MVSRILLTFCVLAAAASEHLTKIPDYLHVCKRMDPDLDKCIQNSVEELRPYLRKGIPEMQVPSIEPLVIPQLVAAEGSGIKIITENLKVFGCSNFTILKLDVNLKKNIYNFNLLLPHLVLDGHYMVNGQILSLPIKGNGNLKGHIYNAKANVTLIGEIVKKKGEDYLHYSKMTIKIKVGSGNLHLDNLFGGSQLLGQVVNSAINANFHSFINELRPIIEKALAKFMLESADKIVSSFKYKDLFPLE